MLSLKEQAVQGVRALEKAYYMQRDMDAVLSMLNEDITLIGTGTDEICRGIEEAKQFLETDKQAFPESFVVSQQSYVATELDGCNCIVYGSLTILENARVIRQQVRLTAVVEVLETRVRFRHIHISTPDVRQEVGESYPTKASYIANQKLRILLENQSKELHKRNRDLEALTENIPGGVQCCLNDAFYTITSCNEGFLRMTGYSAEELEKRFQNRYLDMIHPDDRQRLQKSISEQAARGTVIEAEYRIVRSDGVTRWVLERGQLNQEDGDNAIFYCVLLDITEQKKAQEELRMSLERYQIVMDQTNDIVFEWDVVHDTLMVSANWYKKFGYHVIQEKVSTDIVLSPNVHPEDVQVFQSMISEILAGKSYAEGQIRLRKADGKYLWCRIRVTSQFDADGKAFRSVGIITDIDADKRYSQKLVERAERDGLTGIYNKMAVESRIKDFLETDGRGGNHVLMIIDVDNFKIINDCKGHLFGDAYLSEGAGVLKKLFQDQAYIGRIGGDEFIVLLKDAKQEETAARRATEIIQGFSKIIQKNDVDTPITVSVGLARFPQDAQSYEALFQKADKALYQAKRDGKKSFAYYTPELERHYPAMISDGGKHMGIDSDKMVAPVNNQLIEYILQTLYQSEEIETAINLILAIVGHYYDVSRVYIFENSEDGEHCSNTFEWCNTGVSPEKENLQNLFYKGDLGDYASYFNQEGVFYCADVSALRSAARRILEPQGVKSLLQCAIMDGGVYKGFVGFDECRNNRFWVQEQIDTLTVISSVLSIFLLKARAQKHLEHLLGQTKEILDSQQSCLYVVSEESFELKFLNRKVQDLVPEAHVGKTCYQSFFGRETPCENCPVRRAVAEGKPIQMEIYNPVLHLWVDTEAVPVKWEGQGNHWLLCCHDVTNYKKQSGN